MSMWEYRLIRENGRLRVVEVYSANGVIEGYGEADPHAGETVEEIRSNMLAAIIALRQPILVEKDGKLVEETNAAA